MSVKLRSSVLLCTLVVMALVAAPALAAGVGETCGGIAGLKCDAGLACKYPAAMCNVADLAGKCVKVADKCPIGGTKICGCDGKTYANECELLKAGAKPDHNGACKMAKSTPPAHH